jgi:hypothetical protein
MTGQDEIDLTRHRERVAVAEGAMQTLAAELIFGRNAFNDRRAESAVRTAAQQRVGLVLEALDALKRASLVRP